MHKKISSKHFKKISKHKKTKHFKKTLKKIFKKHKTKRYIHNKKGGMISAFKFTRDEPAGKKVVYNKVGEYGVKDKFAEKTKSHEDNDVPHYHLNVRLPDGKTISIQTLFGIRFRTMVRNLYSSNIADVLQSIKDQTGLDNLTLFWNGKMLLPNMKLRQIHIGNNFLTDDMNSKGDFLIAKYTNQLTKEEMSNVAEIYTPVEGSFEYKDKPDTPRDQIPENIIEINNSLLESYEEPLRIRMAELEGEEGKLTKSP